MNCPHDNSALAFRSIEGHTGYRCHVCLGIWWPQKYLQAISVSREFSWEVFQSTLAPGSAASSCLCPHRCGCLHSTRYGELEFLSCPQCAGVWFERGAAGRFLAMHESKTNGGGVGTAIAADATLNALGILLYALFH